LLPRYSRRTAADRVLIAYREPSVMETARDYLVGKASEMGFSPVVSIDLGAVQKESVGRVVRRTN